MQEGKQEVTKVISLVKYGENTTSVSRAQGTNFDRTAD